MTFSDSIKGKVPEFLLPREKETPDEWHERRFKAYENFQAHGKTTSLGSAKETKDAVAFVKKAIKEGLEGTYDL
jgi:hypothetical protein